MLKTESTLDSIAERVRAQRTRFARLRPADKAVLVRSCLPALAACAETWVEEACRAKGCQHPSVDRIHITGSDSTFERIVWGAPGADRDRRKLSGVPALHKPITAELGNVTPLIVVPGRYSARQLWYQARNLATMVANNASFNCMGTLSAMLVTPPNMTHTRAVEAAIRRLRYGTVALNHWTGLGFAWGSTPWGAYPGGTLADPHSGIGWVHNSYMLEDVHKVVIRGPLTTPFKPAWFADNASANQLGRELFRWVTRPSLNGLASLGHATVNG